VFFAIHYGGCSGKMIEYITGLIAGLLIVPAWKMGTKHGRILASKVKLKEVQK